MKDASRIPDSLPEHLSSRSLWKRLLFMLVFAAIVGLVRMLLWAVVLFQTVSTLITGAPNSHLLLLGKALSDYLHDILLFLTFSNDVAPFPFAEWRYSLYSMNTTEPGQES